MPDTLNLYLNSIAEKCMNAGTDYISPYSSGNLKLLFLYGYYHYIEANDNEIPFLSKCVFTDGKKENTIGAIFKDEDDDNTFDVLCPLYQLKNVSIGLEDLVFFARKAIQEFVNPDPSEVSKQEMTALLSLGKNEDAIVNFKIVSNLSLSPSKKSETRRELSKLEFPSSSWSFDLVLSDDLLEEVSDSEDPQKFIEDDELTLTDPDNIAFHGEEKSFISTISASSLRDLYRRTSTKGLFASNLRYYVKSIKIDSAIEDTIKTNPDDFWYYNNGIIITCSDYSINGSTLSLKRFSIVNGGQTTNIIGNSNFNSDFSIPCKVIRDRFENKDEEESFLGNVAEASNTQKPIKAKDLIANRPEQKHLKALMADYSVFVQIKRGDKVNKLQYPEAWQSTTNDEIAKLLYSGIYQNPCAARNAVSKLFANESIYNSLFLNQTSGRFIKDIIEIRTAYLEWISPKNKDSGVCPIKYDIAKVGLQEYIATICLISKLRFNDKLLKCLRDSGDNQQIIQFYISQRDIGYGSLLSDDRSYEDMKRGLFRVFSEIENRYMSDGLSMYQRYKGSQGGSAANFVRDSNYYRNCIVVPVCTGGTKGIDIDDVLYMPTIDDKKKAEQHFISDYRPGIKEELINLRSSLASKKGTPAKSLFDDAAIAQISKLKPLSEHELATLTKLKEKTINSYGEQIIQIVRKYTTTIDEPIVIITGTRFHN